MNKTLYKQRCSQLRAVLSGRSLSEGIFIATEHKGTRYVYNTLANNIIYKERASTYPRRIIGAQYRPTSVYRGVLERWAVTGHSPEAKVRVIASPNMRRNVIDVRRTMGIS